MGASQSNYDEIPDLTPHVVALKMYLSEAFTTDLKLDGIQDWLKVCHFLLLRNGSWSLFREMALPLTT